MTDRLRLFLDISSSCLGAETPAYVRRSAAQTETLVIISASGTVDDSASTSDLARALENGVVELHEQ